MKLPSGVSEEDFSAAITRFAAAIGRQWVFTSQEDVDLYRDAYSPFKGTDRELVASAAVAPGTVEEVQAIVRIASELRMPLYPISTGKNLGYGGSAPAMSGCVVLDLKRMNRILEVNEANAYALVEPGVSYFDLYHHLRNQGYELWIDTPDPGWGSLIGNAMDRGGGWTAAKYRDHFGAHCGMEVVLPNGELLRTGMGAMPNAKTWQQYKTGFGPWIDGIFSQSNLGVVTKMGFWLMPQPEASLMGHVSVFKYVDLIPVIDTLNYLESAELFSGVPILFGPLTNNKYILGHEEAKKPTPPQLYEVLAKYEEAPYPELEALCRANDMGFWGVRLQFYGPPERGIIVCFLTTTAVPICVAAGAQDAANNKAGEAVYAKWCAACHAEGDNFAGTVALGAKYKGAVPAVLTQRRDLSPELIRQFVRKGYSVMPFFRKTEINDADLTALTAFLTHRKQ